MSWFKCKNQSIIESLVNECNAREKTVQKHEARIKILEHEVEVLSLKYQLLESQLEKKGKKCAATKQPMKKD